MILAWALIAILLLGGAAALIFGLHVKRVNDHPICRRCKFDLIGVYTPDDAATNEVKAGAAVCPECGLNVRLHRAIRFGARQMRPRLISAGALFLLIAVATSGIWGWSQASGFNWTSIKPTWWLMYVATGPDPDLAQDALDELLRRNSAKPFPDQRVLELADAGIKLMQKEPDVWVVGLGEFVELAWDRDLLDPNRKKDYARHALRLTLPIGHTNLRATNGTAIVFPRVFESSLTLHPLMLFSQTGTRSRLHFSGHIRSVEVDGEELSPERRDFQVKLARGGPIGVLGTGITTPIPAGERSIRCAIDIVVSETMPSATTQYGWGPPTMLGDGAQQIVAFTEDIVLEATVVPDSEFELVDDPAITDHLRDAIQIAQATIERSHDSAFIHGRLVVRNPDIDLAMQIVIAVGAREYPAGELIARSERDENVVSPIFAVTNVVIGRDETPRVILRTDRTTAIRNSHLTRPWNGEITFDQIDWKTIDERNNEKK